MMNSILFSEIEDTIDKLDLNSISEKRKQVLHPLIKYIQLKINDKKKVQLNFICTHNSRRSHLAQIWAQTISHYYSINNVKCYSGGTEATALFGTVIHVLKDSGFLISDKIGENPHYSISFSKVKAPLIGFSKTHDDAFNPTKDFAAIMTCSDADDNCPFILGTEKRISVTYVDPKSSDGRPYQQETYKNRSLEIALEMKYVFSKVNNNE